MFVLLQVWLTNSQYELGDKNPFVLMQLITAFSLHITIKKVNLSKFVSSCSFYNKNMAKICVPAPMYFVENVSFTIKLFSETISSEIP